MKTILSIVIAGFATVSFAQAESAHKGWGTVTALWSGEKSRSGIIRDAGMQGPWAGVDQPDPPTNATFQAGYTFKTGSSVTVQKVYMLVANNDGTINTREIKTTPPIKNNREVVKGYSYASFNTEKVSFKEGDVFVVVFQTDGQTIPVFMKIVYSPFLPS